MIAEIVYYLCAALQRFCRRLSRFMAQHLIDRESEWADAEDVEGSLERDALLYAALLQTAGYQPKRNLSCPSCYEECENSVELSKD